MKALSIWQPWASLIAVGVKEFETRHWAPPRKLLGQRIALHASKTEQGIIDVHGLSAEPRLFDEQFDRPLYELPRGALICTAELTGGYRTGESWYSMKWDCHMVAIVEVMPGSRSINSSVRIDPFGNYNEGRWLWRLENVEVFTTPIPFKGRQGIFEVPGEPIRQSHK